MKPVLPQLGDDRSAAIAFVNRRKHSGTPMDISVNLASVGLTHLSGYSVMELFDGIDLGVIYPHQNLTVSVNPSGQCNNKCIIAFSCRYDYYFGLNHPLNNDVVG